MQLLDGQTGALVKWQSYFDAKAGAEHPTVQLNATPGNAQWSLLHLNSLQALKTQWILSNVRDYHKVENVQEFLNPDL